MNESLAVYLNLDPDKRSDNEALLERIDGLLLTVGMEYSGIRNMYLPVDSKERDEAVFQAEKILREGYWLKGILAFTMVGTLTSACPIEKIRTDAMSNPAPEKVWYYERYYQKTGQLAHAVVVDEDNQLRDGYISYLLAKKYGVHADVCETVSGQPLRKVVRGMHVKFSGGKWRRKSKKRYNWIYSLKAPVVPGDILLADTKRGADLICADRIDYIAGYKFCSQYKKVKKHMNMHMEEEKDRS